MSSRNLSELLPFLIPANPSGSIVINKDSSLMASFEIDGLDTNSSGIDEINFLSERVAQAGRNLADQPVVIYWTVKRVKTDDWTGMPMPDTISQLIDDNRRHDYYQGNNFINRHYVTITMGTKLGSSRFQEKINVMVSNGYSMAEAIYNATRSMISNKFAFAYTAQELEMANFQFEEILSSFIDPIDRIHPRRIIGDEYLLFLHSCSSPLNAFKQDKIKPFQTFLDEYLGESDIHLGGKLLRIEGENEGYLSAVSVKGWPSHTFPDMGESGLIETLLLLPSELTISQVFKIASKDDSKTHLKYIRQFNEMLTYPFMTYLMSAFNGGHMNEDRANPIRAQAATDATYGLAELDSGTTSYGWYNFTILCANEKPDTVERMTEFVIKTLRNYNMVAVREKLHLLSAFAGSIPGNHSHLARWSFLETNNMADFAPIRGVKSGDRINKYLTEQLKKNCKAVTVLNTDKNTPFYFNFHYTDLGHTFVVGPPGAGKTTFMNFLLSQYRKYDSRVIIFDKDNSCKVATILQGGAYIDMSPGKTTVTMNPIALIGEEKHWQFVASWIEGIMCSRGYKFTSQDEKDLFIAIKSTAANNDQTYWRLMTIHSLLPNHLGALLDAWVGDKPLAKYFDNIEDNLSLGDFTGMEMGAIMQDVRASSAFLDYVFYRIWMVLDSQEKLKPTIIYIEECWFFMDNPAFEDKIKDWLKTFRKKMANVVLATQSVDDLSQSKVFASIRDGIPTRIFLPNFAAESESLSYLYRTQFELSPEQIKAIKFGIPKKNYFITQPGFARMVECVLDKEILACLSSDKLTLSTFDHWYNDGHPIDPDWKMQYIRDRASM